MRNMTSLGALLVLTISLTAMTGCNGGSASYDYPEASQTTTQLQTFRDTLKPYAETGQLDSGVELLIEQADQLQAEGVSNVPEIKSRLQELMQTRSSSEVKKIAQQILEMLPESVPAPSV